MWRLASLPNETFAVGAHVFVNTQNVVISVHVVVLQRTGKKCTKFYNARAEPLLC